MDFYRFGVKENEKTGVTDLYPGFTVGRSTDLMVRGGKFYAVWDEAKGLWSTDEYDVARLVDQELWAHRDKMSQPGITIAVKPMTSFESGSWGQFQKFISQVSDNSHQLDTSLTFANTEVEKGDYVSKRLPYSLEEGSYAAWDELVGTLYSVEERAKIEWAIGAVVAGDSRWIQKCLVFYGAPGTGKGTILKIVQKLFAGYWAAFDAKALGNPSNQFATEPFRTNPLVGIQEDGDLSKIADNSRLNSIVSHEDMSMNEKFKSSYTASVVAFLFMGTNKPVHISDAKSGMIRRIIDVHPTGVTIPNNQYTTLMSRIDFELGAIAQHCLDVYLEMGPNAYAMYRPMEMMLQTDVFFNYIEAYYDVFKNQDGTTLNQAYLLYKEYCNDSNLVHVMPKYKFREELRNYFDEFKDRAEVDGSMVRSYYQGFTANKFKAPAKDSPAFSLVIEETQSLLDKMLADQPAQGATKHETPKKKWADVSTTLSDIDTSTLHYVQVPADHIVIDFDLKDETGEKSLERNLAAASNWPPTYAELSKGGSGVHLHYNYDGDPETLAGVYSEGVEVKSLLGDSSLRRRLTKCNSWPVATISSGLPLKEKKVLTEQTIQSEKSLRNMLIRCLHKEFNGYTKPSVDFAKKLLDDAYSAGLDFDVADMKPKFVAFAASSSNQALPALKVVQQMRFQGAEVKPVNPEARTTPAEQVEKDQAALVGTGFVKDDRIAFYDIEIYPNLFVICWKFEDSEQIVRMVNPSITDIEGLLKLKLVGFYNRRFDNHILYAAYSGFSIKQLYELSQKLIVDKNTGAMFGNAFSLSYADIWDFASEKKGLKKWMIEMGMRHMEMDIPWDEPVPDDKIDKVVEYCCNDVTGTEAVFKARKQDFIARQVLADLSGLTVNDTTQKHTAKIIFGDDREPQKKFVYTDLSQEFPGYDFDPTRKEKSLYRDEEVGEGGYVYAERGMYENVAVLDIASMHPTTIEQLNLFGEYTPRFAALKAARVAIKHGDYDSARGMLDGALVPYLKDEKDAKDLAYALKIVINIVYGLTSASFDNPFRDIRNRDNIVAKRGALFMIDLKHYIQDELGLNVIHIKTDSVKIANPTKEQVEAITNFGAKYGYDFEYEANYNRFCLVNDAVYIARDVAEWTATGAQFAHPVVFKKLFSEEEIFFDDYCETKQVQKGVMYLDMQHDTPEETPKEAMRFVGKTGQFVPVLNGGGTLLRIDGDKRGAVTGTKGHLWMEADMAESLELEIDMAYYQNLINKAITTIGEFGDYDEFVK